MEILTALVLGFALDLLLGDPPWMPHPARGLGRLITALEKGLRRLFPDTARGQLWGGTVLVGLVCLTAFGLPLGLLWLAGLVNPWLRFALQAWCAYQLLATKSLRGAALTVYRRLDAGDLPGARLAVGQIVGRDTEGLDAAGVARATVETVAENSSDGVLAPMLFFALGGAPLAMLYKAINTMDSMLGYKNERYLYFGRAAAKLDDVANYLPARLSGVLLVAAAALGGFHAGQAATTLRLDHARHTSPNAGWPEAACAGALGVQLGGGALYGGQPVEKPTIGAAGRTVQPQDILCACRLLYLLALLGLIICTASRLLGIFMVTGGITWW